MQPMGADGRIGVWMVAVLLICVSGPLLAEGPSQQAQTLQEVAERQAREAQTRAREAQEQWQRLAEQAHEAARARGGSWGPVRIEQGWRRSPEATPYVGLILQPVPQLLRVHLHLPDGFGLLVEHVQEGSPAAEAGVQVHDILWKLEDQQLVNRTQFRRLLRLREPGSAVALEVRRGSEPHTMEVTLGEARTEEDRPTGTPLYMSTGRGRFFPYAYAESVPEPQPQRRILLGVSLAEVPEQVRSHLRLPEGVGVLVSKVMEGSAAEEAGLEPHDILEKLDDQLLVDGGQLAVLVNARSEGDEVELTLIRAGERQIVPVRLAEQELPEARPSERRVPEPPHSFVLPYAGEGQPRVWSFEAPLAPLARLPGLVDAEQLEAMRQRLEELAEQMAPMQEELERLGRELAPRLEDALRSTLDSALHRLQEQLETLRRTVREEVERDAQRQVEPSEGPRLTLPAGGTGWTVAAPTDPADAEPIRGVYRDPEHEVRLVVGEAGRHLVVLEPDGTVLFEGAVDTAPQRQAVPESIRPKLERLERMVREREEGRGAGRPPQD